MFTPSEPVRTDIVDQLITRGHRAALAARHLEEGRYSKAVEICKEYLVEEPDSISGRLIMARALYHAGQIDSACQQFYRVVASDPDNLVALKYLGDIKFAEGDEMGAQADYARVLSIDPWCRALHCPMKPVKKETTHTITIRRPEESSREAETKEPLREIPFYTETIGDLYLAQGYPRLAADVFRSLSSASQNPRLAEKLARAEDKIKNKESLHVKKTD